MIDQIGFIARLIVTYAACIHLASRFGLMAALMVDNFFPIHRFEVALAARINDDRFLVGQLQNICRFLYQFADRCRYTFDHLDLISFLAMRVPVTPQIASNAGPVITFVARERFLTGMDARMVFHIESHMRRIIAMCTRICGASIWPSGIFEEKQWMPLIV